MAEPVTEALEAENERLRKELKDAWYCFGKVSEARDDIVRQRDQWQRLAMRLIWACGGKIAVTEVHDVTFPSEPVMHMWKSDRQGQRVYEVRRKGRAIRGGLFR